VKSIRVVHINETHCGEDNYYGPLHGRHRHR
jgi:hypothetical protein